MDYKPLAKIIIENIGGKENVKSIVHCATRLRFTLLDSTKANTEVLSKTKGVLKVVDAGGQYQIVIGPDVPQVYQEVLSLGGFEKLDAVEDSKDDTRSGLSKVLESIASIFQPVIPAITGAGLLKAFIALAGTLHWLEAGTQTHTMLNAIADSAFYFLPLLLAMTTAKKFKCNQGSAVALAGVLIYPTFVAMVKDPEVAKIALFGIIPITKASYASSVIPIILGVIFMSYVEHFVQKVCPKAIKFFAVPFISLVVGSIVTLSVLGPIGTWVSDWINVFFTWLKNTAPWLVPTVVGATTPLLVMTGTHYGLIPIGTQNLGSVGHDMVVGPGMMVSNTAQGAAGLAVAVRSKNPDTKQLASSAGITGILGITEPVLYGINLRFTFPLYAAMIGGAVGGLYLGLMGVERFAAGAPGLLVLPVYIPTEAGIAAGYTMANLYNAVIGVVISMAVAFIVSWFLYGVWARNGKLDESELGTVEKKVEAKVEETDELALYAPVVGEAIELSKVEDAVFASGAMGKGFAVVPKVGEVIAPFDGTITAFFPTGHAIGITSNNGIEALIHVGMDTVNLQGEGFKPLVKVNDTVKKGQALLKFDIDFIQSKGYSTVTPVIITNSDSFTEVSVVANGNVTNQNKAIELKK